MKNDIIHFSSCRYYKWIIVRNFTITLSCYRYCQKFCIWVINFKLLIYSIVYIKNLFKEDEEKEKKSVDGEPNKHVNNTSLDLVKGTSLERLSLFKNNNINDNIDDNIDDNNVLFTAFTPPEYVKKLMDNQKLFKTINKDEYYSGIEDFKDLINRDTFENTFKEP